MHNPEMVINVFKDFIISNMDNIIHEWKKELIVSSTDPYQNTIVDNGLAMINLILDNLEEDINEDTLRRLAHKVAEERLEANINIGEFVYNVNLGRSQLFKFLDKLDLDVASVQPLINEVNLRFDRFIYYAVSHYTDLKNEMLQDKINFINATHKDRLSILGQMTSSFVHEFRNPLTSIKGFNQLLRHEYPDLKYLDIISAELEQLNFRVSQFLMLSKKETIGPTKTEFNVEELIHEILDFIYPSLLNSRINLTTEINSNFSFIGYRDEIRQVLINILFNAIDALHNNENDKIITVSLNETIERFIISITNNGPEIEGTAKKTIFEPFFTTKELGTGIGLFVCKQIIEKHGGCICLDSNPSYTTFSIELEKQTYKPSNETKKVLHT
ncbi:HAMP domain-containing sensor histidine kinase [Bacillus tianshenii]|nr:HAMP domain-containing sensor histidine kinase [Bacillus tianshenii]